MPAVRDSACVHYQGPDLDAMERFLTDFRLHRASHADTALYMRQRKQRFLTLMSAGKRRKSCNTCGQRCNATPASGPVRRKS
jgi:hypothetical protein